MELKSTGFLSQPRREIFTPASLAARMQARFDRDFGSIWVEGEIAELSLPQSGHAYFSLKEEGGGPEARLKAVMWKGRRPYAGAALTAGLSVLARGRLAIYAPRGEFQLVVDYLEPRGEGALRLAFEKLKARLAAEGLFEPGRKRPLPFWPARVAVISSSSGAAVRDFIQTTRGRRPGASICLYPVRVQGAGAAGEIAAALEDLNAWGGFDLIVLTRGGGSLSDLWAFNEEAVVRAVAASRTVTLAAIGHSTDLSLAELAADGRAITPTAAAEMVFRDQAALSFHIGELSRQLPLALADLLARHRAQGLTLERRLSQGLTAQVSWRADRLERLAWRLDRFEDRLGLADQRLDDLSRRLGAGVASLVESRARRLDTLSARLASLSPESILRRGYALVTRADGRPAARAGELALGEEVDIRLAEGRFKAAVRAISAEF
ncbi:MAG: exodeoxyribonuclease VII large subunit [Candidatus Adiutrix sp.]|nr:exodeoxyribonuclease VII large subunit [Candidatus Adiutrix sp.]